MKRSLLPVAAVLAVALLGCHEEPTFVITFAPQDMAAAPVARAVAADGAAARPLAVDGGPAAADAGAKGASAAAGDPCKRDADCIVVDEGCCSCPSGGRRIAIAKSRQVAHAKELVKRCEGTACAQIFFDKAECRATASCEAGHCGLRIPVEKPRVAPPK